MSQDLRERIDGADVLNVNLLLLRSLLCPSQLALADLPILAKLQVDPVTGEVILPGGRSE